MYAVIETGGKQYRVQPGDIIEVEKLPGDVGASVELDRVLFLSHGTEQSPEIVVGKPLIENARVQTEVVGQGRGKKILIIKMKRRQGYRKTQGHRQEKTQLLIREVDAAGKKETLSDADRKAKLGTFQSHLKAWGDSPTPKVRVRKTASSASAETAAAAAKPAAKKASASTAAKKAPAKSKPKTTKKATASKAKKS